MRLKQLVTIAVILSLSACGQKGPLKPAPLQSAFLEVSFCMEKIL